MWPIGHDRRLGWTRLSLRIDTSPPRRGGDTDGSIRGVCGLSTPRTELTPVASRRQIALVTVGHTNFGSSR